MQEHLHSCTRPKWARTALAALSVVGLIGLLAASGCINGESIEAPSQSTADDSAAPRPAAAHNLKAAIPAAGDVLIAGGADASNRSLASAEFFDPSSGQFFLTGIAMSSRADAAATALSPTQVLLDGGFSGRATIKNFSLVLEGSALNNAEMFDETTGAFSLAGKMATPRIGFTATALNNSKMLLVGGLDSQNNVLDTAELYDPAARKFIAVANTMSDRRTFHTATLLLTGKVLVAGGATNLSGDTTNSADIYDPATNSFTPATFPMDHQRAAHTATLFPTGPLAGKVLITGGVGGSSFFFKDSSAELYDPASQEFTAALEFHERAALDAHCDAARRRQRAARGRIQRHGGGFGRRAVGSLGIDQQFGRDLRSQHAAILPASADSTPRRLRCNQSMTRRARGAYCHAPRDRPGSASRAHRRRNRRRRSCRSWHRVEQRRAVQSRGRRQLQRDGRNVDGARAAHGDAAALVERLVRLLARFL